MISSLESAPIDVLHWFLGLLGSFGVPAWILAIISALIIIGTIIGVFLSLFALTSVMERKILARCRTATARTAPVRSASSSRSPTESR